ncbi:M48 family metalloprotease [uncultured Alsobacter sp.]|uniref:M48 family metalloprotease n=1 Tax=uncultured Alsobacter sp. TaxID=1748258 RepID=UPI002601056A|nr:M48 family metalloprotease [uncultured Alsobacter sp.]
MATTVALALGATSLPAPPPAVAQESGASGNSQVIIRDAEIEQLLRDYVTPIFGAAGIRKGSIQIVLIQNRAFNAFVVDGKRIFINTGALMDAKTPGEVIGVLAHETGHIAGGHLARLRDQMATAQIMAIVGMLLGAGAMVGAASSRGAIGNTGVGASGVFLGSQEMAMRSLLAYARSEEQAADRMAITYLNATGQSPKGLLETFKRFNQEAMFKTSSIDPYLVSHPMPQERIANLEDLAKKSPNYDKPDAPALQARHDLMRAKLFGFSGNTGEVGRRYPLSDRSLAARYARAIAAYRQKKLADAMSQIDDLLREQPNNAWFWELKGQALLEFGRPQEALGPLRKAVALAPSAGLVRILLGQALVATGNAGYTTEAIRELSNATAREPDWPDGWRQLSLAYGQKGDIGMAQYAAAQSYFTAGDYRMAATQATRAMEKLPKGSPGYLKAEDIVNYRPRTPSSGVPRDPT